MSRRKKVEKVVENIKTKKCLFLKNNIAKWQKFTKKPHCKIFRVKAQSSRPPSVLFTPKKK
jgi:hypothetical protein